jgi:tRNA(fMet)-specific endonuclease VapC
MSTKALLDTDILSAIMKKHPTAIAHAKGYLKTHGRFTISIITRFEILRGLKSKKARTQLTRFDHFCSVNEVLQLTDEIIIKAADIYADLYQRGELISDADILIAASALVNDLTVVTNNEDHFKRITGLRMDNWLK